MTKKEHEELTCANCTNCMFGKLVHKIITKKRPSKEDKREWIDVIVGEVDVTECRVKNPTINGFPEVKPTDFCELHVNDQTGVQTFGKYIVKN